MTFSNAQNETRKAIIDAIGEHERQRPRTMQTAVGCSALGTPCDRQLAFRVAGTAPLRARETSWVATIGISVHAYLEGIFKDSDRFLSETAVEVRHGNVVIPGTVDLYDKQTKTVVDFKVVAESTLNKAKAGRISDQYLTQVNLYALGLAQQGHPVDNVAIFFLPKTKELSDGVFFQRPVDKTLTVLALQRYAAIKIAIDNKAKVTDFAPTDAPCDWCDWYDPSASVDSVKGCRGVLPTFNNRNQ